MPVGDKGDYYWIDDWKYLYTYQYQETRKQFEELRASGTTIHEGNALKVKDQIPEDYWVLGGNEEWGDEFITIRQYWAHKHHYRFVPASQM